MNATLPAPSEAPELYVFTYGTLRPGMGLDYLLRGAVLTAETGTVDGYALYANRSDTYPYLFAEEGATATGTLYLLTNGRQLEAAHHVEIGAGYDASEVLVDLADGSSVTALVWEWKRPQWLGQRIASGDWCEFAESRRSRRADRWNSPNVTQF